MKGNLPPPAAPGRTSLLVHSAALLCCLLLAGLLLAGCAPKMRPPLEEMPSADRLWKRFQDRIRAKAATKAAGFRVKASVNYASPEESHRVVLSMWGNDPLPIRLDLSSGFGSPFSMWRLNDDGWLAYLPDRERAFTHASSRLGAARLGLETPFGLQTLGRILTADFQAVVPKGYSSSGTAPEAAYRYHFSSDPLLDSCLLDRRARLVELVGRSPRQWKLHFEDHELRQGRIVADRLSLSSEAGYTSVLHLKELVLRSEPWPNSSLQLDLPEDTLIVPLQSGQP
jgi:hypothetical protein